MNDRIKVLMVDDEDRFRATTKTILDRRGFDTILAASGEEALEKMGEAPEVIILDIRMPGMDGIATLAEIRKIDSRVPVIMLTGHGSEPSAQEALTQGAFDYLAKPCDIDILASKIKEAARQSPEHAQKERSVGEVMIPLEEYTTLRSEVTVREAIQALQRSFADKAASGRVMETGHRSILVMDGPDEVVGILAIQDLLRAILPAYLKAPKPFLADSVRYSPMFWAGMFTAEIVDLGEKRLEEIMSPAPLTVEDTANLMEATYLLATHQERRLVVVRDERAVGVLREQELFFEMETILRRTHPPGPSAG